MKHHLYRTSLRTIIATCLLVGSAQAISAPEEGGNQVANVFFDNTVLAVELRGNYQRATINVTGPRFYRASTYKEKGNPYLDLREFGELDDGIYRYQVLVASDKTIRLRKNRLNNGREDLGTRRDKITQTETQSGTFRVKGGSILLLSDEPEEKLEKELKAKEK